MDKNILDEQIVFVDSTGKPTGEVGEKLSSHNAHTKLHLAFSCYIFRKRDNKFLLTQRALTKKVWPGVWTNSVCGHPAPGESMDSAIKRRAQFELGLSELHELQCQLPKYIYKTPPFNGIVEHEFCPVYSTYVTEELEANPAEVEAYRWIEWPAYVRMLETNPEQMSYWAKDQYKLLEELEPFKSLLLQ